MALGAILASVFKQLLIQSAAKEAEKTGASPGLIKAAAKKLGASKEETEELEGVEAGAPEIVETDRTFEEQLAFDPSIPESFKQLTVPGPGGRLITGMGEGTQPTRDLPPSNVLQSQIPEQLKQLTVPGPGGRLITGFGEGGQPTRTQPTVQPTIPPGILAGLKESLLNLPTTGAQIPEERIGRQTAFATGETIGDFLRANFLKLSTTEPELLAQPVIDPDTGEVIFERPIGSVFRPRVQTEAQAKRDLLKKRLREEVEEDEFAEDRKQLRKGEILIRRGTKIMAVTEKEIQKDDERL